MAGPGRHRRRGRVREAIETGYPEAAETEPLTGVLLDSDVIIEVLRGRRQVVSRVEALESSGVATYCTAIAWAEIYAGLRRQLETLDLGLETAPSIAREEARIDPDARVALHVDPAPEGLEQVMARAALVRFAGAVTGLAAALREGPMRPVRLPA